MIERSVMRSLPAAIIGMMLASTALMSCQREARETQEAPLPFSQQKFASTTTVMAGGGAAGAPDAKVAHYEKNAWHVSEGQRLYEEYNCVECHAHGGGGIGPPLMDAEWIYGSSSPQIVATLIQGRPNGMPSYRNLLTEEQMWQIAAYVRSLSGHVPKDVPSSRADDLASGPPITLQKPEPAHDSNQASGSK
jgi:cytochrome c oxidase cbb3-type subunit 3